MGHITISLEKKDEQKLRALAKEKYGGKKGALAKAVAEGIGKLEQEKVRDRAIKKMIEIMDEGFDMGRILIKHRSELYDRK